MNTIIIIQVAAATVMCGIGAWTDHRLGCISNKLTVSGMALGFLLGALGGGLTGLMLAVAGAFAAALVPLLLFRMGAMGGGDVKLLFALGALLGVGPALEAEMMAFVLGALQGVVLWFRQGLLRAGLKSLARAILPFMRKRLASDAGMAAAKAAEIRFGPAIFAAAVVIIALHVIG